MAENQKDDLKIKTPIGIVCFPHVWEPHSFQPGAEGKYSLILVIKDDKETMAVLKKAVSQAAVKKWGDKTKDLVAKKKLTMPWRDAAEYEKYGEPFVEGNVMLNLKSSNAPQVVDRKAKEIKNQLDFYAGCEARCSVYAYAYDKLGNMGVTFLLNNIQKTGDGKRLSGRMPAEEEFEALESDDSELEDIL